MRVLVTGGTGYLGRSIVRALAARGHEPVVFARTATRAGLPGTAVDADVRDRAALAAAARGCDALCHSAALVSVWRANPREFDDINVGGLEHALDAAREAGLTRVVYTSSFLARPPAGMHAPLRTNDYQRTKIAANAVARRAQEAGAPLVILYPGVIYGPGVMSEGNLIGRMLSDHCSGRLPGLIGADRVWSYAWIEDVAAAHVAALEHAAPAAHYELGGENAPQMRPFEIARREIGTRLPRRLPLWLARVIGTAEEIRARLTGRAPLLTRGTAEIFACDWPMEHQAARRDLGFRVTPLEDGITRVLAEISGRPTGRNRPT